MLLGKLIGKTNSKYDYQLLKQYHEIQPYTFYRFYLTIIY